MNTPHSQPSPPQGGERAFFSRVPREGGDPDPFTRMERDPVTFTHPLPRQSPRLLRCARNDAGRDAGRIVDDPLTQPSPPEGGEGLSALALSLWERVG
jgi:hypothetical protein